MITVILSVLTFIGIIVYRSDPTPNGRNLLRGISIVTVVFTCIDLIISITFFVVMALDPRLLFSDNTFSVITSIIHDNSLKLTLRLFLPCALGGCAAIIGYNTLKNHELVKKEEETIASEEKIKHESFKYCTSCKTSSVISAEKCRHCGATTFTFDAPEAPNDNLHIIPTQLTNSKTNKDQK